MYQSAPWSEIALGYTPAANNCLPYDSLGINRPGKRCGSQKFFSFQFGSAAKFCQHISWANVQDTSAGTSATKIIVCFGGKAYVQVPGDVAENRIDGGGAATFSATRKVSAVTVNNTTYFSDGLVNKKYDHAAASFADWTATDGTFPIASSQYPRILTAWRGRVVLARLDKGVASTIFMTRQTTQTDFDYGQTPFTADMAVATDSNFRAGQLGEGVTALIPFSNDRLIVGCENSIHEFQGDPADGGTLVPVSFNVGILSDTSWCQVNGVIYFIGTGGLYRMRPGTEAECLSEFAVNGTYRDLPHQGNFLSMAFDKRRHGIWIFVTKVATPYTTRSMFYDLRAEDLYGRGGFWPVSFPVDTAGDDGTGSSGAPSYGPSKACSYDGDEQTSDGRVVLLGCRDGRIRCFDDDVNNDDGTLISSYAWLGPIQPGGPTQDFLLNGHRAVLGEHSSAVTMTWTLKGGPEPYAAYNAPSLSATAAYATGGRQSPLGHRMKTNSVWLKVEDATAGKTFSVARWTINAEAGGPTR